MWNYSAAGEVHFQADDVIEFSNYTEASPQPSSSSSSSSSLQAQRFCTATLSFAINTVGARLNQL